MLLATMKQPVDTEEIFYVFLFSKQPSLLEYRPIDRSSAIKLRKLEIL